MSGREGISGDVDGGVGVEEVALDVEVGEVLALQILQPPSV